MVREIEVSGAFNPALAHRFKKDIQGLTEGDVVVISVTSHGGEVDTLKTMAEDVYHLKKAGVKVATYVPDYAESCGFFFFLLGDAREMAAEATVHYHAPRIELPMGFIGTKQNLTNLANSLTQYQEFTSALFKESSNISADIFAVIENAELPMGRENLVALGIINP